MSLARPARTWTCKMSNHEPQMKDRIDQLLTTDSEMEFFFTLSGSLPGEISSIHDKEHGFGLEMRVDRNLTLQRGTDRDFTRKTTHVFALYQDNTLTWAALAEPPIVGLRNIQDTLAKHRAAFGPDLAGVSYRLRSRGFYGVILRDLRISAWAAVCRVCS